MSEKLPVISGKKLISFLNGMGYKVTRQRGSHVRLEKVTSAGCHRITLPDHDSIANGTLNGILTKNNALWNQMDKKYLVRKLTH